MPTQPDPVPQPALGFVAVFRDRWFPKEAIATSLFGTRDLKAGGSRVQAPRVVLAIEIAYLMENATRYGCRRVGNAWVKG